MFAAGRIEGKVLRGLAVLATALLCACGAATAGVTSQAKVSPTPVPTPTPAPTPSPSSSVDITKLLTKCPPTRTFGSLKVFSKVTGAANLDVAPDGSVWVSTGGRGVIAHLSPDGAGMASYNENTPRALVALPTGDVLFADQGNDRVVDLNPATLAITPFLQLTPVAGEPGVDGLGVDTANSLLLVADFPQSRLLSVPLSGGSPTTLASGIDNPVGAAIGPNSTIEVAAAASTGLWAVPQAGGAATPYQGLSQLSALAVKGLLIYVTAPAKHEVIAFNPATGHTAVLVTGIGNAQGIAVLADGRLVVADTKSGTLATLGSC